MSSESASQRITRKRQAREEQENGGAPVRRATRSQTKVAGFHHIELVRSRSAKADLQSTRQLRLEVLELKKRLEGSKGETQEEINSLQCDRFKSLEEQVAGFHDDKLVHSTSARADSWTIRQLGLEIYELKQRLERSKGETQEEINGLQCDRCKSLEKQLKEAQKMIKDLNKMREDLMEQMNLRRKLEDAFERHYELLEEEKLKLFVQLKDAQKKIEELNKEHETLIDNISEERDWQDREEGNLRGKLQVGWFGWKWW